MPFCFSIYETLPVSAHRSKMHYLLPVVHVIDVIRDGRRGWSDSTSGCNAHTNSGNYERGAKGKGCQRQTSDGRHTTHSCGGAPGDASDLGLLVEIADIVGDGVERDDGLPEDLGSLREDLVEDAQAAMNLVRQDGEGPGIYMRQSNVILSKYSMESERSPLEMWFITQKANQSNKNIIPFSHRLYSRKDWFKGATE